MDAPYLTQGVVMEARQPVEVEAVERVVEQQSAGDPHGARAVLEHEAVGAVDAGRALLFRFLAWRVHLARAANMDKLWEKIGQVLGVSARI